MSETKSIGERIMEFIAPFREYVHNDGGDVIFKSFDEATGVLVFETSGHCVGCSSFDQSYTFGLREWVLANFKEVKEVIFENKKIF